MILRNISEMVIPLLIQKDGKKVQFNWNPGEDITVTALSEQLYNLMDPDRKQVMEV